MKTASLTPRRAKKASLDAQRLCDSIKKSRMALRFPRESRVDMARQFANARWSEEGSRLTRPLNVIKLFCDIVGRAMAAKEPRFMQSTMDRQHQPAVKMLQDHVNRLLDKMAFSETLADVILDALMWVGIVKVGISTPADAAISGWNLPAGKCGVWRVDPDDWVFDTHARDLRYCDYMGHRVRLSLEVAQNLDYFSKRRKDLVANSDALFNAQGDERIHALGRTFVSGDDECEHKVDLWEIYYPRHRCVYTFMSDGQGGDPMPCSDGKALCEQNWIGPDEGPYHWLALGKVPGNASPVGPVHDIYDLDEGINNLLRKLLDQAHRQKTILPVKNSGMRDAKEAILTSDGEAFACENAEDLKEITFGGPSQTLMALYEMLKQAVSWVAGNLDMMGGLSPQSHTATQDKLLAQNASAGVTDKQGTTLRFVSRLGRGISWFEWNHPKSIIKDAVGPAGVPDVTTPRELHPYNAVDHRGQPRNLRRQASFDTIDVRVDPYSLAHQTPEMRVQFLNGIMTQLQPWMPLLQQQGITPDLNFWLSKLAEYGDSPDLGQLFTIQEPPAAAQQGEPDAGQMGGGKPAETTRNYVRSNRSETTGPGQSRSNMQALLASPNGGQNGQAG